MYVPHRPGRTARTAGLAAIALLAAGLSTVALTSAPAAVAAAAPVTITDTFDGTTLDPRWKVVNPDPASLAVRDGALRINGQPGDTYQTINTAKNVVMLDVPAGDFTAETSLSAAVARVYQGAGLIAWKDIDNYVRSGLTFVGNLTPSGIAIERDVETNAAFSAAGFTNRPASAAERLRLQRIGNVLTTSYFDGTGWVTAGSSTVTFDTTQVGLYALAAQDGTTLPAAFDSFTLTYEEGASVTPDGAFALQAAGERPFLIARDGALALSADRPSRTPRLEATPVAGQDGVVTLTSGDLPLVLRSGALVLGAASDQATPMRITDAGGGTVVLREATATGDTGYVGPADSGALVAGTLAAAARFTLADVSNAEATLSIDGDGSGVEISDDMFGIFYEDINYAADGGLYAELVRNRSFEFSTADNNSFNGLTAWQRTTTASGSAAVVNDDNRLNAMNRNHLRLVAGAAGDGVRNTGYNRGFAIKQGATYDGSLWARSATAQSLTVGVESTLGAAVSDTRSLVLPGTDVWTKLPFTLTGSTTTDAGRLVVKAGAASTVGLDMISLMPADRWVGAVNGKSVLRKDLAEKIAAMDPRFVRFPGGCVTNVGTFRSYEESNYTDRRRTYQWKETVGPVEERPTNYNFWGYNQSYGLGYQEYFDFAEDLGAEPLPVVSVGANGCGSQVAELRDRESALFQRWVDDTVDLIEFANGPLTSEWGAKRAAFGHPEPYGLEYIGLGNEENTPTFEANFSAFRDAVKAAYPDIEIISNSGPDSSGARFDTLWKFNRAQDVDLVDEHYYRSPSWFQANNRRYDEYPRTGPKVFLGEYASRFNANNGDLTNLNFANGLNEAAYMTALQRNADVVRLASYAPLLANEDYLQWSPDAIFFDNDESWARPSWHVQTMFGQDPGTETVPSTLDAGANAAPDVNGGVFLSSWLTSAAYDNVAVTDNETGQPLFSDTFDTAASQWTPTSGTWGVSDGAYQQSSTTVADARSVVTGAYTKDWDNYTLEVDAKKVAGSEGFLVGFGAKATNDYYWYNLGGFNNTRALLEKATPAGKVEVAAPAVAGGTQSVVTGQTYKVKIVVEGTKIEIFLDGVRQFGYDSSVLSEKVYQVVTRDEATGEITAKVVNNSAAPALTRITTSDVALAPTAEVTTLAGDPGQTNTKADPDNIAPEVRTIDGVSNDFEYEFPAWSVTFVKMTATGSLPTTPPTTSPTTNGPSVPSVTAAASVTSVKVRGKVTTNKKSKVRVAVSSAVPAAGPVTVRVVRKGKVVATRTVVLSGGRATMKLPRLRKGRSVVTATYAGSPTVAASSGRDAISVKAVRR